MLHDFQSHLKLTALVAATYFLSVNQERTLGFMQNLKVH